MYIEVLMPQEKSMPSFAPLTCARKILIRCTRDEKKQILEFRNRNEYMKGLLIERY